MEVNTAAIISTIATIIAVVAVMVAAVVAVVAAVVVAVVAAVVVAVVAVVVAAIIVAIVTIVVVAAAVAVAVAAVASKDCKRHGALYLEQRLQAYSLNHIGEVISICTSWETWYNSDSFPQPVQSSRPLTLNKKRIYVDTEHATKIQR
jgi:hypothetical protein